MSPELFGAWGQWAGAIATTFAVVVALWIGIRDGRRERAERSDRQAAQARAVVADVVSHEPNSPHATDLPAHGLLLVQAVNRSDELLLSMDLVDVRRVAGPEEQSWEIDPDAPDPPTPPGHVIAHGSASYYVRIKSGGKVLDDVEDKTAYAVTIRYTDARGLVWRRTGSQVPVRQLSDGSRTSRLSGPRGKRRPR